MIDSDNYNYKLHWTSAWYGLMLVVCALSRCPGKKSCGLVDYLLVVVVGS